MFLTDENENTPFHFATFIGYVEGVRQLLNKSTLVAFQRNQRSNLPIHFACAMGHVRVVEELLRVQGPCTSFWLNKKGQNILHVSAMCGQNKMVKYLLKHPKIHSKTINEKDLNGDTPLHLASKYLHVWTLFHLSQDKRINVNLVNDQGLTARDIVRRQSKFPRTRIEFVASKILKFAGGSLKQIKRGPKPVANKEWNVNDGANTLIIVAVLVATVTFAAGFTVPGGVHSSDDSVPKERGMAVLTDQTLFKIFMTFNTIAMYCSTFGSIILLWRHLGDRRLSIRAYRISKIFVQLALGTMPVAFMAAIRLTVSNNSLLADLTSIIAFIFISLILLLRILACFPFGMHLPVFYQVRKLLLWIIITLLCGTKDGRVYDVDEIQQDDEAGRANTVNATQGKNRVT
ncbi:protein ACCELERATED CELL DEATH 6-like [Prosopis cineraria]|uniref:protein ACCELERATED CELL DEATH 6-like n=1 Tax=Prosopis cineraria TaxID=364024 RepID=UPI00240F074F|nr:protein ACCELERATED CELL DEATH 6-like [Prosopis cineraria]